MDIRPLAAFKTPPSTTKGALQNFARTKGNINNMLTADTFQKSTAATKSNLKDASPLQIAREFRAQIKDFEDWKTNLPHDGAPGSTVLKKQLQPFTEALSNLPKKHLEHFVDLAFGEKHLEVLEYGRQVNPHVKQFVEVIETGVGKSIKEMIKTV